MSVGQVYTIVKADPGFYALFFVGPGDSGGDGSYFKIPVIAWGIESSEGDPRPCNISSPILADDWGYEGGILMPDGTVSDGATFYLNVEMWLAEEIKRNKEKNPT